MKKIIAILMAMLMLLNCSAVFAEAAETAEAEKTVAYMDFTIEQYKAAFDTVAAQSGLTCTWADDVLTTYGYPMYYALNPAGNIVAVVHDNDGVFAVETDVVATAEDLTNAEFGNEMGQIVACTFLTAFLLQNPTSDEAAIMSATADITKLVTNLAYIFMDGAETAYEQKLGDNMNMQLSWEKSDDGYMLFFAAYAEI